jgi:hypothetical protein
LSAGKFAGGAGMLTEDFVLFPNFDAGPGSIGFRRGAKGTHTSRTMMFEELSRVLEVTNQDARRADYAAAIIDGNCLSKPTASTRRLSNQRLGELYGLDPLIPLFRVLRRLWDIGADGRPLLALLAAIARDPLLAATCPTIVIMPANIELQRAPLKEALQAAVGERLNDSTLEKVCRNAASTWTQSGHLEGRTFKKRRIVQPSTTAVTLAIYLAHAAGFHGAEIFSSGWLRVLDCNPFKAREFALDAKRSGLLDLRVAGSVVELNLSRLDPYTARA